MQGGLGNGEWPAISLKGLEEVVRASRHSIEGEPARLYRASCDHTHFLAAARFLHDNGATLLSLCASREPSTEIGLTYTFEVGSSAHIVIRASTENGAIDSLFSLFACADFLEREANTLFGIRFLGHPSLAWTGDVMS